MPQRKQQRSNLVEAHLLARQVVEFANRFKRPPTPQVYEVWFRCTGQYEDKAEETILNSIIEAAPLTEDLNNKLRLSTDELRTNNQKLQAQLLETGALLESTQAEVHQLQIDLTEARQSMMIDPISGAGNRRFYDVMINQALENRANGGREVFLFFMKMKRHKEISDIHGQSGGDQALKFIASQISNLCPDASVARYGGAEFALLMHASNEDEARQLSESIQSLFFSTSLKFTQTGAVLGRIELSIGIARLRPRDDRESWIYRANQLLQNAQDGGRGGVLMERNLKRGKTTDS